MPVSPHQAGWFAGAQEKDGHLRRTPPQPTRLIASFQPVIDVTASEGLRGLYGLGQRLAEALFLCRNRAQAHFNAKQGSQQLLVSVG